MVDVGIADLYFRFLSAYTGREREAEREGERE